MIRTLSIATRGRGLCEFTGRVQQIVRDSGVREGLCTLFVQHTSASLLIQENADPSVLRDLERWFERLAPDGDALWTHTAEGPDDMPSHARAALTQTHLAVPIVDGRLALGTWQGVYQFYQCRESSRGARIPASARGIGRSRQCQRAAAPAGRRASADGNLWLRPQAALWEHRRHGSERRVVVHVA